MSLISNGNFSSPIIATDSFIYYTDFTSDQSNSLVWGCSHLNVALQNGNTAFLYPNPATLTISTSQFISIQYLSAFQQMITIPSSGYYTFQFNYAIRPSYSRNPINIYIGSTLKDTFSFTDTNSTWQTYIQNEYCYGGTQQIIFQGKHD